MPRWEKTLSDEASMPDGYSGDFLKACWGTIKVNIMALINQFLNLHADNFHLSPNIALVPEKKATRL
jgi:hypothetical protein